MPRLAIITKESKKAEWELYCICEPELAFKIAARMENGEHAEGKIQFKAIVVSLEKWNNGDVLEVKP